MIVRLFGCGLFFVTAIVGAENKPVDPKLAEMVEQVVASTSFRINISEMQDHSININQVNGNSVCDPVAEKDVRALQEAFDRHPNIYQNYSKYHVTVTKGGKRTIGDYEVIKKKGLVGDCINVYVSVQPEP